VYRLVRLLEMPVTFLEPLTIVRVSICIAFFRLGFVVGEPSLLSLFSCFPLVPSFKKKKKNYGLVLLVN
jgi:hypothetical protein